MFRELPRKSVEIKSSKPLTTSEGITTVHIREVLTELKPIQIKEALVGEGFGLTFDYIHIPVRNIILQRPT